MKYFAITVLRYRIASGLVFNCICIFAIGIFNPAFAQSEAESSQNVVRISEPKSGKSWEVRAPASARLKTHSGERLHGRIDNIQDSSITVRGRAVALRNISSMRVTDSKKARAGLIVTLTGILLIQYIWAFIALLFSASLSGAVAFLFYLFAASIFLGPLLYIIGLLLIVGAAVHFSRERGWRIEIRKRRGYPERNKVSRRERL